MGGALFGLAFLLWSGALATLVVLANVYLVVRRRQTLGLAYFGLAMAGGSSARLLSASAAMWLLPPLGAWLLGEILGVWTDPWGVTLVVGLVPGVVYGSSAALWSRPARRGLGDRLAGRRIVLAAGDTRRPAVSPILIELLLLLPPCLAFPLLVFVPGGLVGSLAAIVCAGLPVLLRRRGQARAPRPILPPP